MIITGSPWVIARELSVPGEGIPPASWKKDESSALLRRQNPNGGLIAAMKRRRNIGLPVLLILLIFIAFATVTPSIMQNRKVREFADELFYAYQTSDEVSLKQYYTISGLSNFYLDLMDRYDLLGWKVTGISGQPYPAEVKSLSAGGDYIYNKISADLYYKPVDKLVKPKGRYSRFKHPKYGDCMVVPVTISFSYHPEKKEPWILKHPDDQTSEEWVLPFDKPLPKSLLNNPYLP